MCTLNGDKVIQNQIAVAAAATAATTPSTSAVKSFVAIQSTFSIRASVGKRQSPFPAAQRIVHFDELRCAATEAPLNANAKKTAAYNDANNNNFQLNSDIKDINLLRSSITDQITTTTVLATQSINYNTAAVAAAVHDTLQSVAAHSKCLADNYDDHLHSTNNLKISHVLPLPSSSSLQIQFSNYDRTTATSSRASTQSGTLTLRTGSNQNYASDQFGSICISDRNDDNDKDEHIYDVVQQNLQTKFYHRYDRIDNKIEFNKTFNSNNYNHQVDDFESNYKYKRRSGSILANTTTTTTPNTDSIRYFIHINPSNIQNIQKKNNYYYSNEKNNYCRNYSCCNSNSSSRHKIEYNINNSFNNNINNNMNNIDNDNKISDNKLKSILKLLLKQIILNVILFIQLFVVLIVNHNTNYLKNILISKVLNNFGNVTIAKYWDSFKCNLNARYQLMMNALCKSALQLVKMKFNHRNQCVVASVRSSSKSSRKPSLLGIFMPSILFVTLFLGCADVTDAGACWIKRLQNGKCKEIFSRNITKEECCKPGNDDFAFTDKELSEAEYFLATAIGDGIQCASCIDSCETFKCSVGKRCVLKKGRPKCICAPLCKAASKEKRKIRPNIQSYHQHLQQQKQMQQMHMKHNQQQLAVAEAEQSVIGVPAEALLLSSTSQKNDIRVIDVRHHDKLHLVNYDDNLYPKRDKRMVFYGIKRELDDQKSSTASLSSSSSSSSPPISSNQDNINHHRETQFNKHNDKEFRPKHHHQHRNQHQHEYTGAISSPSQKHKPTTTTSIDYEQTESTSQYIESYSEDVDDMESDDVAEFDSRPQRKNQEIVLSRSRSSSTSSTSSIELIHHNQRRFKSTKNTNKFIDSNDEQQQSESNNAQPRDDSTHHLYNKNSQHHARNNQHQHHDNKMTQNQQHHRNRHHNQKNAEFLEQLTSGGDLTEPKSQNIVIKMNLQGGGDDDYSPSDPYSKLRAITSSNSSILIDKLEKSLNSDNNQIYSRRQPPLDKFSIVNFSSNEFNMKSNNMDSSKSSKNNFNVKSIESYSSSNHHHRAGKKHKNKHNQHHMQQQHHLRNQRRNNSRLQQAIISGTDTDVEVIESIRPQMNQFYERDSDALQPLHQLQQEKAKLRTHAAHNDSSSSHNRHLGGSSKRKTNPNGNHQRHHKQKQQQNQKHQNHHYQQNREKNQKHRSDALPSGGLIGTNNYAIDLEDRITMHHGNRSIGNGGKQRQHKGQQQQRARQMHRNKGLTLDEKIRNDYVSNGFSYPHNADQMLYVNPVCGTDGRTYRSECQLKKRACRQDSTTLIVAYRGYCQTSCKNVKCQQDLTCVEDQYGLPHCIKCSITCPSDDDAAAAAAAGKPNRSAQVCGYDGQTYDSVCHLNRQVCLTGRSVGVAYNGPCVAGSTCETVSCGPKKTCLKDLATNQPRCVTCSFKCPRKKYKNQLQNDKYGQMKICGNNNHTYHSWCHMRRDSCNTDLYIDIKHIGACHRDSFASAKQPDDLQQTHTKPQ